MHVQIDEIRSSRKAEEEALQREWEQSERLAKDFLVDELVDKLGLYSKGSNTEDSELTNAQCAPSHQGPRTYEIGF